ncbi:hypothetical protein G4Y79_21030 [Phototrophicus methaneseepsis]|uniref:Uncharacterized protein n=1 Tax=Phototrophicus methaneseepsis TaxID=2710758 RepID=A0A7S8IE20_9CHLR|nr:hypothetical protein [Phototrophicus methaneseepsis]QPC82141.1 hypothetical protein G4Y79_21030 [Phototrophicus methaneseepsis]
MINKQLEESHLTFVNAASLNPALNLADILDLLDQIHNVASEDGEADFTDLSEGETISLLRDVIYTAQETINEIEARRATTQKPILHLVEKHEKIG